MNPARTEQWKINFQLIISKRVVESRVRGNTIKQVFPTPSIGMKINSNYVNVNYSWVGNNAGISLPLTCPMLSCVQNLVICEEVNKSVITSHQRWFVAS